MINASDIVCLLQTFSEDNLKIDENSPLVGGDSLIDSMGLVQLCLALEDMALEKGFNFDWTSEKAMSDMKSIYKSPKTLADEFNRQSSL